jgi:hypothetical protein
MANPEHDKLTRSLVRVFDALKNSDIIIDLQTALVDRVPVTDQTQAKLITNPFYIESPSLLNFRAAQIYANLRESWRSQTISVYDLGLLSYLLRDFADRLPVKYLIGKASSRSFFIKSNNAQLNALLSEHRFRVAVNTLLKNIDNLEGSHRQQLSPGHDIHATLVKLGKGRSLTQADKGNITATLYRVIMLAANVNYEDFQKIFANDIFEKRQILDNIEEYLASDLHIASHIDDLTDMIDMLLTRSPRGRSIQVPLPPHKV